MTRARFLFKLVLTLGLLALLFWQIPFADVAGALGQARPGPLIAALLCLPLARLVAAYRMKRLARRQDARFSTWELMEISCTSTLYSLALPGSLSGGLIRWHRLAQAPGGALGALSALATDRWMDTWGLITVGFLCTLPEFSGGWARAIGIPLGLAWLVFMLISWAVLHPQGWGAGLFRWLEGRGPQKVRELLQRLSRYQALSAREWALIAGLSLTVHALGVVSFYYLTRTLSLPLSLTTIGWIRTCTMALGMLPITIAGLGVREGALLVLLAPYGIAGAQALALSGLRLIGILVTALAGGLFELGRLFAPAGLKSGLAAANARSETR